MFTKYNLPIDIPAFFQHFRDGDIPIGIADFNTYVQLLVAAPEITGLSGFLRFPVTPRSGFRRAKTAPPPFPCPFARAVWGG